MGRNIKEFHEDGVALDGEKVIEIRFKVEGYIEDRMRESGYVKVLDMTPELYWQYDWDAGQMKYLIRLYGMYVGKVKAKKIMGMLASRPIYFMGEDNDSNGKTIGDIA